MNEYLLEVITDNCADGIYVLDDKGFYIFANSVYVESINMTKSELIGYDVHNFVHTKMIDFCISDIVYKEKRRVVMFQDVYNKHDPSRKMHRQLIISTPIFDDTGNVRNIVAIVRRLDTMHDYYQQASMTESGPRYSDELDANPPDIIAESSTMHALLKTARSVADIDSVTLITGESGTGKEVVAQYIHASGKRAGKPMVIINCASLPANLLEAELFGYEKGAFTGALHTGRAGLFEAADGGTLFLDEVNSLPLDLQGKLLRAIETKQIQRLGSTRVRNVDFRLLAASNEDLHQLVEAKRFRADLFYRLNVIPLFIPPLRERSADIIPLTLLFLRKFCEKHTKHKVFSENTLNSIKRYHWPGNVRELKNFVERSVVMSMGEFIEIHNIEGVATGALGNHAPVSPATLGTDGIDYAGLLERGTSLNDFLAHFETNYIQYALENTGSTYEAAKILGTSQSSIMRRKKKFRL